MVSFSLRSVILAASLSRSTFSFSLPTHSRVPLRAPNLHNGISPTGLRAVSVNDSLNPSPLSNSSLEPDDKKSSAGGPDLSGVVLSVSWQLLAAHEFGDRPCPLCFSVSIRLIRVHLCCSGVKRKSSPSPARGLPNCF